MNQVAMEKILSPPCRFASVAAPAPPICVATAWPPTYVSPMPSVNVRCSCGKAISVAAEHRGRQIKCRQCGRIMQVPAGRWSLGTRRRVPRRWLTALTALAWAYLAVVAVLGILLWSLGDVWWPATVLLFLGRWVLLLPLLVLVPAAIVIRPVVLLPLAAAAVLVAGPVMGFRTGWRRLLPHPGGTHVRVVSFNADGGGRIAPDLALLLAQWEPDIVALQECGPELAEATRQQRGWHHHDVRQICFLSRFPIVGAQVMDRSALESVNEDEVAGIGGSGDVARYTVQTPTGLASVTNLHLETPRKGLEALVAGKGNLRRLRQNTELRAIESKLARQWVDSGRGPSLVAGDFNTPIESRIFQRSWGDFTDAFARAGFGLGMTKANGWISVRIDHVLTGPGWTADAVTLGRSYGSDHRALIVDLTLTAGPVR